MAGLLLLLLGVAWAEEEETSPWSDEEPVEEEDEEDDNLDIDLPEVSAPTAIDALLPGSEEDLPPLDAEVAAEIAGLEAVDLSAVETALPPPRLRPWLGLRAGLALNKDPLSPSFLPGAEVGLVLPWLDERLRPFLSAAWNAPATDISGSDPALPDGWTATVRTQQGRFGLGLAARLFGRRTPVSPELLVLPQLWTTRTLTETRGAGSILSTSAEHQLLPAFSAGLGLGGDLGPGQLAAHCGLTLARSSGTLTGDASLRSVDLTLGYRLEL